MSAECSELAESLSDAAADCVAYEIKPWGAITGPEAPAVVGGCWVMDTPVGGFALVSDGARRWNVAFGFFDGDTSTIGSARGHALNEWVGEQRLNLVRARTRTELAEILAQTIQLYPPPHPEDSE